MTVTLPYDRRLVEQLLTNLTNGFTIVPDFDRPVNAS